MAAAVPVAAIYEDPPSPLPASEDGNFSSVDFTTNVVITATPADPAAPAPAFVLSRKAAEMSVVLKDLLHDNADPKPVLPISIVSVSNLPVTLGFVVQYLEYHKDNKAKKIEGPLRDDLWKPTIISPWDRAFLYTHLIENNDETKHSKLLDVLKASNFLNIKDLMDLTCASVAQMLKGKKPQQIRDLFGIVNDFPPEEEKRIRDLMKYRD